MRRAALAALALLALLAPACAQSVVTVMMTGDGYTEEMRGEFDDTCAKLEKAFQEAEPFDRMKGLFKFVRVFKASAEKGCTRYNVCIPATPENRQRYAKHNPTERDLTADQEARFHIPPSAGRKLLQWDELAKNTHYGVRFGSRGEARVPAATWYEGQKMQALPDELTPEQLKKVREAADAAGVIPAVAVVLTPDVDLSSGLNNDRCRNPHGLFSTIVMTGDDAAHPADALQTFIHEMGHAAFGLGDEYGRDGSRPCQPPEGDLGDPANLTVKPKSPPWKHLIDAGILKNDPIPGGMAGCSTGIWHPTQDCMMNTMQAPFCVVCLERIVHARAERSKLILDTQPTTKKKLIAPSGTSLTFKVRTSAAENDPKCQPRYVDYFELDGRQIRGSRHATAAGSDYDLIVNARALPVGTHRIRFTIGDGLLFCTRGPQALAAGERPAMPWDSADWWLLVVPKGLLNPLISGTLTPESSWD